MQGQSARASSSAGFGKRALWLAGVLATILGFHQLSFSYGDFLLPQQGVTFVPERELAFYAYYGLCGLLGLWWAARLFDAGGARGAFEHGAPGPLWRALLSRPRQTCLGLSIVVFVSSALFRQLVLEAQPIADDEGTYLFIARTLLSGHVVNPVPQDSDLLRNQFIVSNQSGWYGKYPIGHPLVLALGEALHLRDAIVPLVAALCVPLTFGIGRRLFGAERALVGTALLAASPHFVWTAATLLSQPTACLMLLSGVWLALRAQESERMLPALLAGLAFGMGILVRPLPSALFALVAVIWGARWVLAASPAQRTHASARAALLALGSAAGGLALLAQNYVQTGDALSSGYHQVHGSVEVFNNEHADIANSVFGALLRENFWLLGVPGSLVIVLFARPVGHAWMYWSLLAAELAYRVIAPKTVVNTTGPIYLTEAVPLLLLGCADGLSKLRARVSVDGAALRLRGRSLALAALLIGGAMFVPVQWRTIRRGVETRSYVRRALEQSGAQRALVFADVVVHPSSDHTWAYFPDNPSPDLSDDIVFVRVPKVAALSRARELWQRRFADRRAFALTWTRSGEPVFEELERLEH